MHPIKCSMLSASVLALSTGWAAAAPAVVLDYLNLRYGPGYEYYIIEVIPAGWVIDAGACFEGWCQVSVNGVPGYVDANYLGVPAPQYYWTGWTYPNYAYYYGYAGGGYAGAGYAGAGYYGGRAPYADDYGDYYGKGRDADLKAARRATERPKNWPVARNAANVPPHPPRLAGPPTTTGAATPVARPNRVDQYQPR
jgi:uncharacterized protein YraI